MRKVKFFIICLLGLAIFISSPLQAGSIGVRPLVIELDLAPGERGSFEITLFSTSPKEPTPVHLSCFDPVQQLSGSFAWEKVGANPYSCASWIRLEKEDIIVPGGGEGVVKAEIKVPRGERGTRIATVMVEPSPGKRPARGVTLKVRYAVFLRLHIKGRVAREKLEVKSIAFRSKEGKPEIEVIVANKSDIDFKAEGIAQIIDPEQRRIRERIPINTPGGFKRGEPCTVYPGGVVALRGEVTRFLGPGQYNVQAMIKYGRRRRAVAKDTLTVKPGDFPQKMIAASGRLNYRVRPESIEIKAPPGSTRRSAITVKNNDLDPIKFRLTLLDAQNHPRSCLRWLKLGQHEFTLKPGSTRGINLMLVAPMSVRGQYHAQVLIQAYPMERKQSEEETLANQSRVNITAIAPTPRKVK